MNTIHQNGTGNGIGRQAPAPPAVAPSELSYRRLFDAAEDGILILDADAGRVSDVNPFLVNLLGFSRSEMIGKTVGELSPFRDVVANQIMLERLQQNRYVRYDNLPLETRDGRQIAVEFVSNVHEAGDKKVIQCNIRDITKRKQMEDALRASEARYRSLYNCIDEGFCVVEMLFDVNGQPNDYYFLEVNPAFEKQSGLRDVLGKRMRELVPDQDSFWYADYGRVAQTGEPMRFEKKAAAMNRWFDVLAFRLGEAGSATVAILFNDITARKLEEENMSDLNLWLEQRVSERTAELKSAVEELEAFSYSVSHDLRAPLRHITGFVNLLQNAPGPALSEKNLKHLATISHSARRMGILIDDLLDFSRIGRAAMQMTDVNLDELVRDAAAEFLPETDGRNITWEIKPLPLVRGDRALLQMVLVNLIANAVKFTGRRAEARIEIGEFKTQTETKTAESPPATPMASVRPVPEEAVIYIRDNGAGFDPQYAGKLFGVFQRLHSAAEFEGTGIGLANVQRIIHRHGGRVWAEGAVNVGATFYFSLPKRTPEGDHGP